MSETAAGPRCTCNDSSTVVPWCLIHPGTPPAAASVEPKALDESGLENAAIALMEMRGGPGEPMRDEARVAVQAYLALAPAEPASGEPGDWREAGGATPRRAGDEVSPEEAIRRIRGHAPTEPVESEPVAQYQWRLKGGEWHNCSRSEAQFQDRGPSTESRALYTKPVEPKGAREAGMVMARAMSDRNLQLREALEEIEADARAGYNGYPSVQKKTLRTIGTIARKALAAQEPSTTLTGRLDQ